MSQKFYAVHKGKTPGIYPNWEECKKQIEGVSGARYKGFKTREEAEAFVETGRSDNGTGAKGKDAPRPKPMQGEMIAYVDGSYNVETGEFSYGLVAFVNEEEIHLSEKMDDNELSRMRNVAGEIKGSEAAMKLAIDKGCKKLTIYHDYEGIAKWCLGDWKTNREGTIAYKKYYDSVQNLLKVEFVKVKSHSHDKYNDLADELAKKAVFRGE